MKRAAAIIAIAVGLSLLPGVAGAAYLAFAEVPTGAGAGKIALDGARDRIFVLNQSANTVTIVRASTLEHLGDVVVGSSPNSLAVHAPSGRVYVVNAGNSASILVIDGLSVVDSISFGSNGGLAPEEIVYEATSDRLFVRASRIDPFVETVFVVDPVLNRLEGSLPGPWGNPQAMTVDTRRGHLIVADGNLQVHDTTTWARIASFPGGAHTLGYDPGMDRILGSSSFDFDGYHFTVDPVTGQFSPSLNITDHPGQLAADPITGRIFSPGRVISIIDPATMQVVGSIPGGNYAGIAYDAQTRRLYATNVSRGTLVVIADDAVAPSTSAAGPSGDVADAFADITFDGADDAGAPPTFECALDGAPFAACAAPARVGPLADGAHAFDVRAVDAAGNRDASPARVSWSVIPEANAPGTTIVAGPPAATTANQATFTFEGTDDRGIARFECAVDAAAFTTCENPRSVSVGDGPHVMRVRAIDLSGNPDPSPAERSWAVDHTPPESLIIGKPPVTSNAPAVEITFTGSDTVGPVRFQCSLGPPSEELDYEPCTSPLRLDALTDGLYLFAVRAIDGAGNIENFVAFAGFRLDRVTPVTTLAAAPPDPSVTTSASVGFGGTDDISHGNNEIVFRCTVDGVTTMCIESPLRLTGLSEGPHEVVVRAVDRAGNVDPVGARAAWVVATAAPAVSLPAAIGAGSIEVTVDGVSGATAVVSLDDPDTRTIPVTGSGPVVDGRAIIELDGSSLTDGTLTAQAYLRDTAGNRTPQGTATGMKDHLAPRSAVTTSDGAVLIATPVFSSAVRGTATDAAAGLAAVHVIFRPTDGGAATEVAARLSCDDDARTCTWDARPPITPGRYAVAVGATDRSGNVEAAHDAIEVMVL